MNQYNFSYIITQIYNNPAYCKGIIRKTNISYFKTLLTHTTDVNKDIFILQQKNTQEQKTSADAAKASWKSRIIFPHKL